MNRRRTNAKFALLASITVGTCMQFGLGCVQAVFASIGATFF